MLKYCTRCKIVQFEPKPITEVKAKELNERGFDDGRLKVGFRWWCGSCHWWMEMENLPADALRIP